MRRIEQLRQEAEAFFAAHPPAPPPGSDGWRRVRSIHDPETEALSSYTAVLQLIAQAERDRQRRRWAAAATSYDAAERAAERARHVRQAEESGEIYEAAYRLRERAARQLAALQQRPGYKVKQRRSQTTAQRYARAAERLIKRRGLSNQSAADHLEKHPPRGTRHRSSRQILRYLKRAGIGS
jgi:hypothetical protein